MSTIEMKLEMYETLAQIHDEKKIRRIYEAFQRILNEEHSDNRDKESDVIIEKAP